MSNTFPALETILIAVIAIIFILFIVFLQSLIVLWAWNYVVPRLFSLPSITFLHALALNLLSWSLIKSVSVNK